MKSLFKSSLRYLIKHPWQFGLSVIGIAMGVAIVVSIDIANYSSARAFNLSMNAVAGKATHQIIGPSEGITDSFYTYMRTKKGFRKIAPVIESYFSLSDMTKKIFKLLGVDFFAERPFRDYLSQTGVSINGELKDFITIPNTIIASERTLSGLGKGIGDTLKINIQGKQKSLIVAGFVKGNDQNRSALENLFITDISSAQSLTEKVGMIDYIDVIANDPIEEESLADLLPNGYELIKSAARSQTAEQMIEAFNINLTSLSLLALIVGLFLVYNTMTFSVVQRKVLIGTLRSIGVTAKEITMVILIEALVIGVIGTIVGFILAYFISKYLLVFISQTINDLYFVLSVREISISPLIIVKGILLGVLATMLSALKPAKEASKVHPRSAMIRSTQESSLIKTIPRMSISAIIFIFIGAIILMVPSNNIWVSYLGILPIIVGFALLTPLIIFLVEKIFSPVYKSIFGVTCKLSSRSIIQNISRTYIAIAALALAVAATVGVGTMITSFRSTVVSWLEARLNADLFISSPSLISRKNDVPLPSDLLEQIKTLDNVEDINFYREIEFYQDNKKIRLIASGLSEIDKSGFKFKGGDPEQIWKKFKAGELLLSEPYAYKNNLDIGYIVSLRTDVGMRNFNIAGIYYDYASDEGLVTIHYDNFKKYWFAKGLSGISVFVKEGVPLDEVRNEILNLDIKGQDILVRTFKFIRDNSIEIFDRTFQIAKVLQILSIIVAFVGILSSLMSLQLERKRELGILRANGLLPSQLFKIVNLQTGLMGFTAGILALPLGNILAAILVFIINKRSFGWTMQFEIIPSIILEALILSIIASLLAGIYPGIKMSKSSPALALREE